jgi:hypothetical protein
VRPQSSDPGSVEGAPRSARAKIGRSNNSSSSMNNKAVAFQLENVSMSSSTTVVLPKNSSFTKTGSGKSFPGQKLFMRALGKT